MLYYEHLFKDETGIRIVDMPNEALGREVPTIQLRVAVGKGIKLVKCELYDHETGEDLFEELVEGLLKLKIKEIGKECENCGKAFLPNSPAQKFCPECIELRA